MDQQELMIKLEMTYRQAQEIEEKLGIIDKQINELKLFKGYLKELSKSDEKEVLASLGKGVFMKSELKDRMMFVDVGAGFFVKKNPDETFNVLVGQVKRLGEIKIQLHGENERVNLELQRLIGDIEKKEVIG